MPVLTVTLGIPGSGKSTWASAQAARVVSADIIRRNRSVSRQDVFRRMRAEVEQALSDGVDVIVDACSTNRDRRLGWIALAEKTAATTRLVVFKTPLAVCKARNAARLEAVPGQALVAYVDEMRRALSAVEGEGWGAIEWSPTCASLASTN